MPLLTAQTARYLIRLLRTLNDEQRQKFKAEILHLLRRASIQQVTNDKLRHRTRQKKRLQIRRSKIIGWIMSGALLCKAVRLAALISDDIKLPTWWR